MSKKDPSFHSQAGSTMTCQVTRRYICHGAKYNTWIVLRLTMLSITLVTFILSLIRFAHQYIFCSIFRNTSSFVGCMTINSDAHRYAVGGLIEVVIVDVMRDVCTVCQHTPIHLWSLNERVVVMKSISI
jgi:hypothetical protein